MSALSLVFITLMFSVVGCSIDHRTFGSLDSTIPHILRSFIQDGHSLHGTSVRRLMPHYYNVETAGAVENFSKWPLYVKLEEQHTGITSLPLTTIAPAEREAFASHHPPDTAFGIWAQFNLTVHDNVSIHLMYSIGYNHDFYDNKLAIAICRSASTQCSKMDAYSMYYNKYDFLDRQTYKQPTKMCFDDVCAVGTVEKLHHPEIYFYVFPKSFSDVSVRLRATLTKLDYSKEDYEGFVKDYFSRVM